VALDRAGRDPFGHLAAREDVVDPPTDVALPHLAPRRPPREQRVVVRVESARDVDEASREDVVDELALVVALADDARLALLDVDVAVRQRDVDVAADDDAE